MRKILLPAVGLALLFGLFASRARADESYATCVTSLNCQLFQVYNAAWLAGISLGDGAEVVTPPTLPGSSTLTAYQINSITAHIGAPVGSAATIAVYVEPDGAKCTDGQNVASGTINANPAIYNSDSTSSIQPLTLTTTQIPAGNTLCLHTTGFSTASAGYGGIRISTTPIAAITNCSISGSAIGSAKPTNSPCTQITNPTSGEGSSVWTITGGQIYRNGVLDPVTSSVTILMYCPPCGGGVTNPTGMWQFGSGSWYYSSAAAGTSWPGWTYVDWTTANPGKDPR